MDLSRCGIPLSAGKGLQNAIEEARKYSDLFEPNQKALFDLAESHCVIMDAMQGLRIKPSSNLTPLVIAIGSEKDTMLGAAGT